MMIFQRQKSYTNNFRLLLNWHIIIMVSPDIKYLGNNKCISDFIHYIFLKLMKNNMIICIVRLDYESYLLVTPRGSTASLCCVDSR